MSKKLVNEPIFVNNINELNDAIIAFNRHQKVKFNCSKCGKEYVVSIDAILKREIILYEGFSSEIKSFFLLISQAVRNHCWIRQCVDDLLPSL